MQVTTCRRLAEDSEENNFLINSIKKGIVNYKR
jgi:hypothetical protein